MDLRTREVCAHGPAGGELEGVTLGRETGEVLSADAYVHVTTSRGVDLSTAPPAGRAEEEPRPGRLAREARAFTAAGG